MLNLEHEDFAWCTLALMSERASANGKAPGLISVLEGGYGLKKKKGKYCPLSASAIAHVDALRRCPGMGGTPLAWSFVENPPDGVAAP